MPVTDNIDDLVNDILNTVDYVEKDIPRELVELATQLQLQLQKGGKGGIADEPFKNRTGNVRRSMSVTAGGEQLKISMLVYGYFLSFGVDGRKRKESDARALFYKLCREYTNDTYETIGEELNRDHTTVIHACKKIKELVQSDLKVSEDYNNLRRQLSG